MTGRLCIGRDYRGTCHPRSVTAAKELAEFREVSFHLSQGQNLRFCMFVLKQSSCNNCISLHLSHSIYLASLFLSVHKQGWLVPSLQTRVMSFKILMSPSICLEFIQFSRIMITTVALTKKFL